MKQKLFWRKLKKLLRSASLCSKCSLGTLGKIRLWTSKPFYSQVEISHSQKNEACPSCNEIEMPRGKYISPVHAKNKQEK